MIDKEIIDEKDKIINKKSLLIIISLIIIAINMIKDPTPIEPSVFDETSPLFKPTLFTP